MRKITPIFDLTQTTRSALHEVEIALLLSILLVALVMLVFLRRLRPTLIATLSVPLSLAGAFIVMWSLGYTLNTLSLVALVPAGDHAAMIGMFFATKVWVLKERFTIRG